MDPTPTRLSWAPKTRRAGELSGVVVYYCDGSGYKGGVGAASMSTRDGRCAYTTSTHQYPVSRPYLAAVHTLTAVLETIYGF
ncbi:hypothetical protein R3P38DRAFT_2583629 [Favolaschia claudopus]|uniref:RNase H type-1 domain-containing protein n=1 Tax=Favolaschia claudopus TaxID=2862362 RepID=A0AAV9Z9Y4_9AGAR